MQYPEEEILLVCDGSGWLTAGTLIIPSNVLIVHISPYTPEMNPIEQIRYKTRLRGFKNEVFHALNLMLNRLCDTIRSLIADIVKLITGRDWILSLS